MNLTWMYDNTMIPNNGHKIHSNRFGSWILVAVTLKAKIKLRQSSIVMFWTFTSFLLKLNNSLLLGISHYDEVLVDLQELYLSRINCYSHVRHQGLKFIGR